MPVVTEKNDKEEEGEIAHRSGNECSDIDADGGLDQPFVDEDFSNPGIEAGDLSPSKTLTNDESVPSGSVVSTPEVIQNNDDEVDGGGEEDGGDEDGGDEESGHEEGGEVAGGDVPTEEGPRQQEVQLPQPSTGAGPSGIWGMGMKKTMIQKWSPLQICLLPSFKSWFPLFSIFKHL